MNTTGEQSIAEDGTYGVGLVVVAHFDEAIGDRAGTPLEVWQNGDWSVPWDQWLAGSAL